jgi:hypothetical protein
LKAFKDKKEKIFWWENEGRKIFGERKKLELEKLKKFLKKLEKIPNTSKKIKIRKKF